MKIFKTLLPALFILGMASLALAQAVAEIDYFGPPDVPTNVPLGTPCTGTRLAFGDSVAILVFWDRNMNGPSADDPQPPSGVSGQDTCNQNLFNFNGESGGLGAGFFSFDPQFTVYFLPDTPVYYLRISRINPPLCWTSDTFRLVDGPQTVSLTYAQWNCQDTPCQINQNPPNAPQHVVASDDQFCLSVRVSWDPLQSTQSAFNIYHEGGTTPDMTVGAQDTFAFVPVLTDEVRAYYVKAANSQESPASNSDNGSTYLVRFAPNTNITGENLAGHEYTVFLQVPPEDSIAPCSYNTALYLLHSAAGNGVYVRQSLLAADSLNDSLHFTLPNLTLNHCRLLLEDSSRMTGAVFTDTTTGEFHLGSLGAGNGVMLPDHFALAQNYPNPFNPTTEIQFTVPVQAEIKIHVYNVMGQLVKTLAQGSYAAGIHNITWDGKSDGGIDVSAGIYIYRMEGPNFVQAKKMLLLK